YSFYDEDAVGRPVNRFYWDAKGSPLRFDNLRLRFSSRIRMSELLGFVFPGPKPPAGGKGSAEPKTAPKSLPVRGDKFADLLGDFSISHELGLLRMGQPGQDTTLVTTHSVNMVGSMRLTPNWTIFF